MSTPPRLSEQKQRLSGISRYKQNVIELTRRMIPSAR